jgi:transposase
MVNIKLEIDQDISGRDLELLYSKEKDPKVKERLLMLIHTKEGKTTREVAKVIKKSHVSVAHWINRFNEEGIEGLKDRKRSGKPPKMNRNQFESLKEDLNKSPREFGYKRDFWTTKLVKIHILQHYITSYTNRHVQRLLHKFGYSLIKPRPRHTKRDVSKKEEFTETLKKTRRVWTRMDSSNNG